MKVFLDTGRQRKLLILYLFIWNIAEFNLECGVHTHGEYTVLTNESLIMHEFPDGTVITHECRLGYVKTSGTGTSNCVNGKWTEPDIICRKKDCGPLEAKPHMIFDTSQSTLFGAILKVTCEEGYHLLGLRFKSLNSANVQQSSKCTVVTCSKPAKVENGEHSWSSDDKPEYLQKINFSCNTGYTLIGSVTMTCTSTGEYDYGPPQCIG
uniref:Sushi domain-containing protein n=1 Tax=Poecilia formosa TaxID=48698 RepID=A0A096LUX0_POEFO